MSHETGYGRFCHAPEKFVYALNKRLSALEAKCARLESKINPHANYCLKHNYAICSDVPCPGCESPEKKETPKPCEHGMTTTCWVCTKKETPKECPYCGGDIWIRNPTGHCDHLHYPDNVNKSLKPFPAKETPKEFSGYSTATPKYCYCPREMPCDCGYNYNLDQKFNPSPAPEKTLEGQLRVWLKENHNKHLTANHWKQALISNFKNIAESHYRERFEKATKPGKAIPWHDTCNFTFTDYLRRELFGEKEVK